MDRRRRPDRTDLADARSRCPDLDTIAALALGFAALVRHQGSGHHLDPSIDRARHAAYPELRADFAGQARQQAKRSAVLVNGFLAPTGNRTGNPTCTPASATPLD